MDLVISSESVLKMASNQRTYQNTWSVSEKIYVIPGNQKQGLDYVKKHCMNRIIDGETSASMSDYVIVTEGQVDKLRGIHNPRGVFVGTWKERKDLHDICIQLNLSHDNSNVVIHRIMQQYLGY
jgi:hypothetical protein